MQQVQIEENHNGNNYGAPFPVAEPPLAFPSVQQNFDGHFGYDAQFPGIFPGVQPNTIPPQAVNVPLVNALRNLTILHLVNPDMRVIMFDNVFPGPDGGFHVWMAIPLNINF